MPALIKSQTLIFSGYGVGGGMYTHDVKVAKINGSSYLTYFSGVE